MQTTDISSILWALDPMRTGCADNDNMEDEYDFQAQEIAELVGSGMPIRTAVVQVFDFWFWEDCLISGSRTDRLDAIVEKIAELSH